MALAELAEEVHCLLALGQGLTIQSVRSGYGQSQAAAAVDTLLEVPVHSDRTAVAVAALVGLEVLCRHPTSV